MFARLLTLLALASIAAVPAAHSGSPAGPTGLRAFLLRADEPVVDAFPRTPSFAWTPYNAALRYQFQLSTSRAFDESTIVWAASGTSLTNVPALAVPIALPWATGNPYALYARVRALTAKGVSRWSAAFGFNMRWKTVPEQLPDLPGLVRWTPVEGATSYEVWFVDAKKVITTTTSVADEREFYTFPQDPTSSGTVQWRVRAVRKLYGELPNGLPVVSYGPWSPIFVSTNGSLSSGPLMPTATVSGTYGTNAPQTPNLTPGFSFTGNAATDGTSGKLYRVYVATDRQCVNIVFTGSIVGSPAYAPRTSGPLALPASVGPSTTPFLSDGNQTNTFAADRRAVTTSEQISSTTTPASSIPSEFLAAGPFVDLWDIGSPNGRYWWTVVPVSGPTDGYRDVEVPQDACASGRVLPFAKTSQPATTSTTRPYVSGLSPAGELVAARTAKPSFYRAALAAWGPAAGAIAYQVQWSRTRYPWRPASTDPVYTPATSMLLAGLAPGTWFYRVRGIDPYMPGALKWMTWSKPVEIRFAKPRFIAETGITVRPVKK